MTEKELIRLLKQKNENAFKQLVDQYQVKVRNSCLGMVHDTYESDDIAQEVFIEVFYSIHKFKEESTLGTWIYRITINKCLNHIRSKKRRKWIGFFTGHEQNEQALDKVADDKQPQHLLEESERAKILQRAIDSLPESQRAAFVLSKYENLSNPEIAEILKTTISSVESLNFRAKRNLQKKLVTFFKENYE